MSDSVDRHTGTILAVLKRFEEQRLPRALEIKARVDAGERLTEADMEFLRLVSKDSRDIKALADREPRWQDLYMRAVQLYKDILDRALENERRG